MTTLDEINNFMVDGDSKRGNAILEKIARLAGITDGQQQFMYQTVTLLPTDARDFLAFLAAEGILIQAIPNA